MTDYGGDGEYQEKIKTLLFNIKNAPPARAIQAAGRIGDIGVPDKQLIDELTNLSNNISDDAVRAAILSTLERLGASPAQTEPKIEAPSPSFDINQEPQKCPFCAKDIKQEDTFCPVCGKHLKKLTPDRQTDSTKKCPFCAEDIKQEAIVCRYCGRDLVPRSPTKTPPSKKHQASGETPLPKVVGSRSMVWDGVRLGFGMFIVLPLLIIGLFLLILLIPYYSNYNKTSCDQAALADLYNVKAAVQNVLSSGTTSVSSAVDAVLSDTTGKYGYPGPTTRCGVVMKNSYGTVTATTSKGTDEGKKGWTLYMGRGQGPAQRSTTGTVPLTPYTDGGVTVYR